LRNKGINKKFIKNLLRIENLDFDFMIFRKKFDSFKFFVLEK